jgi:hypothetical protein
MEIRDTEPVVGATRQRESSCVGEAVAVAPVTGPVDVVFARRRWQR